LVISYGVGQYFVLAFVKKKINHMAIVDAASTSNIVSNKGKNRANRGERKKFISRLMLIHTAVCTTQYALTAILISIIALILFASHYYTALLTSGTVISYSLAIVLLGLLAQRFFSWFRLNKDSVVLSYALASSVLTINLVFGLAFMSAILLSEPSEVVDHITTAWPIFSPDSSWGMLYSAYVVSGVLSFILLWVSTALLLRHHSKKVGNIKFWIIVIIPLAYFVGQFTPIYLNQIAAPLIRLDPISVGVILTLIFSVSKAAGGILFGVAFWAMAKGIQSSSTTVRDYLIISAVGTVLLFVSIQGTATNAAYPPFGIATVCFTGLSSYMLVIGLYSSAVSISEDIRLRQAVRDSVKGERVDLLDRIGTAQMEQEIASRVLRIVRKQKETLEEQSGVEPSFTEDDMKQYLEQVIQEVKMKKTGTTDNT
jgi:hypothetical protein